MEYYQEVCRITRFVSNYTCIFFDFVRGFASYVKGLPKTNGCNSVSVRIRFLCEMALHDSKLICDTLNLLIVYLNNYNDICFGRIKEMSHWGVSLFLLRTQILCLIDLKLFNTYLGCYIREITRFYCKYSKQFSLPLYCQSEIDPWHVISNNVAFWQV